MNRTHDGFRWGKPLLAGSSLGSHVRGAILGGEFAGVVEQVGDGVTTFSPGERVFRYSEQGSGRMPSSLRKLKQAGPHLGVHPADVPKRR